MLLADYLRGREETQVEFAARSGIPQQTIASILAGGGTRATTALIIMRTTGGLVSLEDLCGQPQTERGAA